MLRQLPANGDMDLFLGATKVPYTFCDLDEYRSTRESLIRIFARIVRQEELVVHGNIARFVFSLKMGDDGRKGEEEIKNTRAEELLIDVVDCFTCFYMYLLSR